MSVTAIPTVLDFIGGFDRSLMISRLYITVFSFRLRMIEILCARFPGGVLLGCEPQWLSPKVAGIHTSHPTGVVEHAGIEPAAS